MSRLTPELERRIADEHPTDMQARANALANARDRAGDDRPVRGCKNCGEPCLGSWCSALCHRVEDLGY